MFGILTCGLVLCAVQTSCTTRSPGPTEPLASSAASSRTETSRIIALADASNLNRHVWPAMTGLQGETAGQTTNLPIGYIRGIALTYAEIYRRLKKGGDIYTVQMTSPVKQSERDALHKMRSFLAKKGLRNFTAKRRLRNLFVIMYELGARESDGRYYLGIDTGENKPDSDAEDVSTTTEAGLFQSSWNYAYRTDILKNLFADYRAGRRSGPPLRYFAAGVPPPHDDNDRSFGDGEGYRFQEFAKQNPSFAVEFAALTLRGIGYGEYHFIKFDLMEINPEIIDLLKRIEAVVDEETP